MIYRPLQGRNNGVYWYILQTYSAAEIAYNRYVRILENTDLIIRKHGSDLWVKLKNGATIFFKSGKNYQDLRLETLDGAIIDEVRQQHKDLWSMIVRPMLARRKGWCDFYSTPDGFDHFKDIYDFAQTHPDEWACFHAPSIEAWWWDSEEIASAKSSMTTDVFEQEIMADFREMGAGKVYYSHGAHNHLLENPFAIKGYDWCHYLPIIVGLDFNVGLMVWELGQRRGNEFYYGDEIAVENTDTEQCAMVLVNKVLKFYTILGDRPKPGLILIGDASGNARRTSAVGETDYKIIKKVLRDAKISFEDLTPSENPFIKDRVNCMNGALKASDGTVSLRYNPLRCKYLKRDFERVKWKQGTDGAMIDKKDPLATHASDAGGYPIVVLSDVFKSRPGVMRVINR